MLGVVKMLPDDESAARSFEGVRWAHPGDSNRPKVRHCVHDLVGESQVGSIPLPRLQA